ncbi:MAG TPA: 2OG-Fe(II) oxygenase [Candidatus Cybelea sp.]|nr:2OG-Fe(II) oxygenase [Candidatus Cybelea sp.]
MAGPKKIDHAGDMNRATQIQSLAERIDALDWSGIAADLDARGFATTGPLLSAAECADLVALYGGEGFRSRVVMQRHNFGRGEYKYFSSPLPEAVQTLRAALYPHLAPVARRWAPALGLTTPFPDKLSAFLRICHEAGQKRPTPLLLRYEAGDYNCLHQDIYGDVVFPLQLTIALTQRSADFEGGEFVLVEQRPRAQSRAEVVPLMRGEGVIFATRHRPAAGTRGTYRTVLRHGVSRVTRGLRFTLGVIFHDAA